MSTVLNTLPAAQDQAIAHFTGRLAFETDPSDVAADIGAGVVGWVLVDSRSQESWDQGHVVARSTCRPARSPPAPRP